MQFMLVWDDRMMLVILSIVLPASCIEKCAAYEIMEIMRPCQWLHGTFKHDVTQDVLKTTTNYWQDLEYCPNCSGQQEARYGSKWLDKLANLLWRRAMRVAHLLGHALSISIMTLAICNFHGASLR